MGLSSSAAAEGVGSAALSGTHFSRLSFMEPACGALPCTLAGGGGYVLNRELTCAQCVSAAGAGTKAPVFVRW